MNRYKLKVTGFLNIATCIVFFITAGCDSRTNDVGDAVEDEVLQEYDTPEDFNPGETNGDTVEDEIMGDPEETGEEAGTDVPETDVPEDEEDIDDDENTSLCGNSFVDPGEVCDDGNNDTEFCGRSDDCLGDCSLLAANCGNGEIDEGEECDDADTDSMDDCTTSCTINDNNIGAPCICEGPECSVMDLSAGNIVGCDNVEIPPGSGGELVCIRSWHETITDTKLYMAEGSCTIFAIACEGMPAFCDFITPIGDLETFACPPGYYELEIINPVIPGVASLLAKTCAKICTSPAQCMWNAYDEYWDECGQIDCIPSPTDPSVHICLDERGLLAH